MVIPPLELSSSSSPVQEASRRERTKTRLSADKGIGLGIRHHLSAVKSDSSLVVADRALTPNLAHAVPNPSKR
jgi:hypothetical protein